MDGRAGRAALRRPAPIHPGAWALWALAAALPALTTRNPAYLVLLLLAVGVVQLAQPARPGAMAGWRFFLRAGLFLWLLTIPLNALTTHYGRTVLFTLPQSWPLLGGPVSLEAAAYGFLSGLAWLTVLVVFATLSQAVDPYQLLRAAPPLLYQTGVMASIGLSFIPQAAVALREIREAQAIRGHRGRGLRDVGPLVLPLLTTGLERSLQLAESMESRGFGAPPLHSPRARAWGQRLLLLALLLVLAGLLLRAAAAVAAPLTDAGALLGAGLLLLGGALLVFALVLQGRGVRRSRYRPRRWAARDTVVALCAGLTLVGYGAVLLARPALLAYVPYPQLSWPAFHPAVGGLFLLLTAPAWFERRRP